MIRFKRDDGSNYPECQDKKMKDVITLLRGSSPRPIVNYVTSDGSGVNWIKIGDMPKTGSLVTSVSEKITEEGAKKSRKVNIGDLILSNSMSFGKPYILGIEGYIHDGWFVIRDYEENFNRDYLCQLLASETVQHQYNSLSAGGVVQNISSDIVNSVKIKLPCLEEQQKIADFLSSVDDVITASEQEVAALEEQKKGAMQKIFSQEVRFKADDGSDYPEWEEKRLEEIGEFYGGLSGKTKDDFGKGEDKYITYMNVYKNTFAKNELLDTVIISENEKQNRVKYGDVLFTQSSETVEEVGLTSVYLFDDEPTLNSFCFGLRTNDMKETYPEFMGYLFRTEYVRKQIMREGQGISRINLSPNRIRSVSMFFPCLKEQQKIANFLSDFDKAIDLAKQELEQWKELKKGLLQQLFE